MIWSFKSDHYVYDYRGSGATRGNKFTENFWKQQIRPALFFDESARKIRWWKKKKKKLHWGNLESGSTLSQEIVNMQNRAIGWEGGKNKIVWEVKTDQERSHKKQQKMDDYKLLDIHRINGVIQVEIKSNRLLWFQSFVYVHRTERADVRKGRSHLPWCV